MDATRAEETAMRQIEPGERLLWSGSPAPRAAAIAALPGTVVGVPFTGFAVFWVWSAFQITSGSSGPGVFLPLFAAPFILVGLGLLASPLWGVLRARGTVYAVTERRALVIIEGPMGGIWSYGPGEVRDLMRHERADGSGSVFFAWRTSTNSRGFERHTRVGFIGVPDVRRVERLIREQILERAA